MSKNGLLLVFTLSLVFCSACKESGGGSGGEYPSGLKSPTQTLTQAELLSKYEGLIRVYCQKTCRESRRYGDSESCEAFALMSLREDLYERVDAMERGAIGFDQRALQCAISELQSVECAEELEVSECGELFVPLVPAGGPCRSDNECVSAENGYSYCAVEGTDYEVSYNECVMGVCVVEVDDLSEDDEDDNPGDNPGLYPVGVGESCSGENTFCAGSLECYEDVCVRAQVGMPGAPCGFEAEVPTRCGDGYICAENAEELYVCTQIPSAGAPCPNRRCDSTSYCDMDPVNPTCQIKLNDGEACDSESPLGLFMCRLGSYCIDGVCNTIRFAGESFGGANTTCNESVCVGGVCEPECVDVPESLMSMEPEEE